MQEMQAYFSLFTLAFTVVIKAALLPVGLQSIMINTLHEF